MLRKRVGPGSTRLGALAATVSRLAPEEGRFTTTVPGLELLRCEADRGPEQGLSRAKLVVAAQGHKRVVLGERTLAYGREQGLLISTEVPLTSQIVGATPQCPYLAVIVDLDLDLVRELLTELPPPEGPMEAPGGAVTVIALDEHLLDAIQRLLQLLDAPGDAPFLAPLIAREVHYRLLHGEGGAWLRQLAIAESHARRVSEGIDWLRDHFAEPLRIDDLAARVHLSASALHRQFKAQTSMTPLQFQKQLRLYEARRLLVQHGYDAAAAAHRVGYVSPSQFAREYARLFGESPTRDRARLAAIADPA